MRLCVPGAAGGLSADFPGQQVDEPGYLLNRYHYFLGPALQTGTLYGDSRNRDSRNRNSRKEFAFQDFSDLDGAMGQ